MIMHFAWLFCGWYTSSDMLTETEWPKNTKVHILKTNTMFQKLSCGPVYPKIIFVSE